VTVIESPLRLPEVIVLSLLVDPETFELESSVRSR